jgi:transposase
MTGTVLRVGRGRGFVIEVNETSYVVTAAHCLPDRPGPSWTPEERIYANLLGPLDAGLGTTAECAFSDPVADIAILGEPSHQELGRDADAYRQLMATTMPFAIGQLRYRPSHFRPSDGTTASSPSGRSPLLATEEQRAALTVLAGSRDRGEADRARAMLLTLAGWTSPRIAEAFGVREDTVRLWRSDFMGGGVEALKASVAPGPAPVKSEAALRVVTPLLEEPVADRRNWTIPRLRAEIEARVGVRISRSQLSKALRKKSSVGGGRDTR